MKHLTKTQSLLVLILFTSFSLIGCASDKATSTSSTTTTTATANAYFSWKDSQCYDSYSATYVNTQYCTANRFAWNSSSQCWDSIANYQVNAVYCSSSTTTTGTTYTYYWQNNACYQSTTGVIVANSYCGVTSTANQCYGYYYYYNPYYYQFQMIYCSGTNCKGYTLYTYGTSQQVTCG